METATCARSHTRIAMIVDDDDDGRSLTAYYIRRNNSISTRSRCPGSKALLKTMTPFILLVVLTVASAKSYDGHRVLKVFVRQQSDVSAIAALGEQLEVDFWHYPHHVGDSFQVRVAPEVLGHFMAEIRSLGLDVDVMIDNVQTLVDRERSALQRRSRMTSGARTIDFDSYYTMGEIETHLDGLHLTNYTTVEKLLPRTAENRALRLVKISNGESSQDKKTIFIDCGIHAREWISPAFCLYLIQQLKNDSKMLEMFDWQIIPVSNPDGYVYSHAHERLWRKNRRNNNFFCYGVDLNRNFATAWGGEGTSSSMCSDIYRGQGPHSELETQAVANATLNVASKLIAYLNVHAYSQFWMLPWGFTNNVIPDDYARLEEVAYIAINALYATSGTQYLVGNPYNTVKYNAAGGIFDWVKDVLGVKYSYALELRDDGYYGFVLPEDQIRPTVIETWAGVRAMACAIHETGCN
ncbi:carboxypeptidase B-like [Argopecten irradians]|uniref:carboxypeptidase B-like n=1 Tax=Argopecten irradians TaxID=31199 RepID=UPI003718DAD1